MLAAEEDYKMVQYLLDINIAEFLYLCSYKIETQNLKNILHEQSKNSS